jgi:hypothetical protein
MIASTMKCASFARTAAAAVLLLLPGHLVTCQRASALTATQVQDFNELSKGVGTVELSPYTASKLFLYGKAAMVVAPGPSSAAMIAAARLGKGRIIHFSHEGMLGAAITNTGLGRMLLNAARWASGKTSSIRVAGLDAFGAEIAARLAKVCATCQDGVGLGRPTAIVISRTW